MKKISDDLYLLIQSLDKSEKGYFRKYVSRNAIGEQKNYIKLFNAIEHFAEKGKPYDEKQIKEKYKKEKFISRLSFTKAYLYDMILRSLSSYDAGKSINSQINDQMEDIIVLFRRGFYNQCLKLIKRVKKLAYKNEQYLKLYDILRYEKNVYVRTGNKNLSALSQQIFNEQIIILDIIRNNTQYAALYNEAFDTLDEYGLFKGTKDEKRFDEIMKNLLLTSDSHAKSFSAKLYFYGITYTYYIAKGDFEKVYYYIKKLIDIQDSKSEFKKISPFSYYTEYINIIDPAIYLHKNDEVIDIFNMMDKVIEDKTNNLSRSNRVYFQGRIYTSKLMFYVRNWTPGEVCSLIDKSEYFNKYKGSLSRQDLTTSYYYIALFYFYIHEADSSLEWLNKIDIDFQNDYYLNYYSSIPILKILVHYELSNYSVIESLVQSMRRYLSKNKTYFELETEFLKTIEKLADVTDKRHETELLKTFQKNIMAFSKDHMFYNLDLLSWAEGRIKNKNISEILSEKELLN